MHGEILHSYKVTTKSRGTEAPLPPTLASMIWPIFAPSKLRSHLKVGDQVNKSTT